jgi:hypothetical protein
MLTRGAQTPDAMSPWRIILFRRHKMFTVLQYGSPCHLPGTSNFTVATFVHPWCRASWWKNLATPCSFHADPPSIATTRKPHSRCGNPYRNAMWQSAHQFNNVVVLRRDGWGRPNLSTTCSWVGDPLKGRNSSAWSSSQGVLVGCGAWLGMVNKSSGLGDQDTIYLITTLTF